MAEATRPDQLGLELALQVARVEEPGVIVDHRQLLDALKVAPILEGDGGVVGDAGKGAHVGFREHRVLAPRVAVDQLDHTECAVLAAEGHRQHRGGLKLRDLIDARGKARVLIDVRDQHRLAFLRDPAGDALPDLDSQVANLLAPFPTATSK